MAAVLADGQRVALQEIGHMIVEVDLKLVRREVEGLGKTVRVVDQARLLHLPAQGAFAQRRQAAAQQGLRRPILAGAKLGPEGVLRPKEGVVDDADQPEQLHQIVLQRRRGQQELLAAEEGVTEQGGARVFSRLVDIAELVGFVKHHQVPVDGAQAGRNPSRVFVGQDDHGLAGAQGIGLARLGHVLHALRVENYGGEGELLSQLLSPLFAERRRRDQQDQTLTLPPALRHDQRGLDRLAETHLIGEQDALGEGRAQGEQRRIHLVRVEIDARRGQRLRQALAFRHALAGKEVGEILSLERRIGSVWEHLPLEAGVRVGHC